MQVIRQDEGSLNSGFSRKSFMGRFYKKNPFDVLYYFLYYVEEKNARTRTGEVHS